MQEESEIECPYCGETITILIDTSVENQKYIEDCSVCCRPISLEVLCEDGEVASIAVGQSD